MEHDNGIDGLRTIHKLSYTVDSKSENPNDNVFVEHNQNIYFINIATFMTYLKFEGDQYYNDDLKKRVYKIYQKDFDLLSYEKVMKK